MKRFSAGLIAVAVLVVAPSAFAFSWEAGLRGGLTFSKFRGENTSGTTDVQPGLSAQGDLSDSAVGVAGALFGAWYPHRNLGLQIELGYVQRGGAGHVSTTGTTEIEGDATFVLGYAEIPLLVVASWPVGERTSLRLHGGGVLGLSTDAKVKLEMSGDGRSVNESFGFATYVAARDLGAAAGVDIVLHRDEFDLVFTGRWTVGLDSVHDADPALDIKNSSVLLAFGVGFPR